MDVKEILDRINENAGLLRQNKISEIERDILLEDIRSLYTIVKGTGSEHTPKVTIIEKPSIAQPTVSGPVIKAEEVATPQKAPVTEKKIEETIPIAQPVISDDPIEIIEIEKKQERSIPAYISAAPEMKEAVKENKTKTASLNEVFAGEDRSLNERMGGPKKSMLNDHALRKDLKGMIDFNKQYILTNELFKGNGQAFQDAIARINESPTIEAAFEYIKTDLLPVYKWNAEMQSARLFDKLVRQKFGL